MTEIPHSTRTPVTKFYNELMQVVLVSSPNNALKQKVGAGGFEYQRLLKAERRLKEARNEFPHIASRELQKINNALYHLRSALDGKSPLAWIRTIFDASIELKANSGLFSYSIINAVSQSLMDFTRHLTRADEDSLTIVGLHYDALNLVFEQGHDVMTSEQREELLDGLHTAVARYQEQRYRRP